MRIYVAITGIAPLRAYVHSRGLVCISAHK
jgi:hypothetical protein